MILNKITYIHLNSLSYEAGIEDENQIQALIWKGLNKKKKKISWQRIRFNIEITNNEDIFFLQKFIFITFIINKSLGVSDYIFPWVGEQIKSKEWFSVLITGHISVSLQKHT